MNPPPPPPPPQRRAIEVKATEIVFEDDPSIQVKKIVDQELNSFELRILACAVQENAFYSKVSGLLCVEAATGVFAKDFTDDIDNAVFVAVRDYHNLLGATADDPPMLGESLALSLIKQVANADIRPGSSLIIALSEIDAAVERFKTALHAPVKEALAVVSQGFNYWLSKQRMTRVVRQLTTTLDWNAREVLDAVQQQIDPIDVIGEVEAKPFGAGLDEGDDNIERIPTGLRCLDTPLGGGLARGDFTLFIAGTGVGKTVVATQLAGHFAGMGLKGLLITTEEKRQALELRMISNFANIPYSRIVDKLDERLLQPGEIERYRSVRTRLENHLTIVEWLGDRGRSVAGDLETEVRKCKPDFVILDWIGGALGETTPEMVRLAFQAAADKLAAIARRQKIICIGMAQAHPKQSYNKAKVNSTMLCECKTMGQRATNIIGMSGLEEPLEDGCESEKQYRDRQFFYVSKARKSKGGLRPFIREFDYQRIRDV